VKFGIADFCSRTAAARLFHFAVAITISLFASGLAGPAQAQPSLSPSSLPADTINLAYNQTITASGGTGSHSIAITNIQNA
jgi:hypothetical protein